MGWPELADGVKELAKAIGKFGEAALKMTTFIVEAPGKIWNTLGDIYKGIVNGTGDVYELLTRPRKPREDLEIYKGMSTVPPVPPSELDPSAASLWKMKWIYNERIRLLKIAIDDIESREDYQRKFLEHEKLEDAIERLGELRTGRIVKRAEVVGQLSKMQRTRQKLDLPKGSKLVEEVEEVTPEKLEEEAAQLEHKLSDKQPWPDFDYDAGKKMIYPKANTEKLIDLRTRLKEIEDDEYFQKCTELLKLFNYEVRANQYEIDKIDGK